MDQSYVTVETRLEEAVGALLWSFRPAFFYVSETRKCGKVFGKPFSGAEFIQRTLFRISARVW